MALQSLTAFLDAITSMIFHFKVDLGVGKYAHSFRLCLAILLRISTDLAWPIFQFSSSGLLAKEHLVILSSFYQDQLPTLHRYRTVLCRVMPSMTMYHPNFTEELTTFQFNPQLSLQQRLNLFAALCNLWTKVFILDSSTLRISFLQRLIHDLDDVCRICQSGRLSQSHSGSFLRILQEQFFLPFHFLTQSYTAKSPTVIHQDRILTCLPSDLLL
jgi:hypothetical protein